MFVKTSVFIGIFFLMSCSLLLENESERFVPLVEGERQAEHHGRSKAYMVATQGRYTTMAGREILQKGGNVIDAAVAISFAISVERPHSTGLGGGGFLLYYRPEMKKPISFDFREKAPLAAYEKMYLDKNGDTIARKSLDGIFAVATPGLVKGVLETHRLYGKLPLETIMTPAITLAKKGFIVYPELARALKKKASLLRTFPSSAKIFLKKDGSPYGEGELLIQKDLAYTLELIAKKGVKGFYEGKVASEIVKTSQMYGGLLTKEDFRKYNVVVREPITGSYKDYRIYSMAPPSSGGVHVIQILNTIEKDNLSQYGPHHPQSIHLTAMAMQQAFADRARYLGDSDFVKVPLFELTSKGYARGIRKKLDGNRVRKKNQVYAGKFKGYDPDHTTHFSVMDGKGHTVVSTQTINGYFGSGLVVEGTGVVLNNEMDDFAMKVGASNIFGAVGGQNNLIVPEKRPLSSMSPTIVTRKGRPVLALGTPAGTRILTCVAQTILNYVEHGKTLYESVALTRYHQQWSPDILMIGKHGIPRSTERALKSKGHKIHYKNLGCRIQAIAREGGSLIGVSDPRGYGMVWGH